MNNPKEKHDGKTYQIENLDQICNVVNEDNIESFLLDFAAFLSMYIDTIKETRNEHPELTKNLLNTEIIKAKFIWINDGKNEIKGFTIKNSKTGEIKKIK
jgi:hypothetical protein